MKNKRFYTPQIFLIYFMVIAVGCKKVASPEPLGDNGQTIVKFYEGFPDTAAQKSSAYKLINLDLVSTPQIFEMVELRRDVANNAALNKPLTVTIENDPGAVSSFDASQPIVSLPAGTFAAEAPAVMVGNNYSITFEPGEFAKIIKVKILNATALDLSKRFGLGFRIVSIEGEGKIAQLEKSFVVELGVKNQWDGVYSIVGDFVHPTQCYVGPFFTNTTGGPREIELITISPNALKRNLSGRENLTVWDHCNEGYIYFTAVVPRYQVNSDNSITILDGPEASVVWDYYPGMAYDPATKTFNLHYGYNGSRIINETLKYVRPR
jgi:hypothetical protein